ncbi:MAG: glycosyltransferase family 2 protein [Syntrophus sp. (in: bacteria)]|nr:glycosyltransferase family 2 protein [Syntrophus sp. (in: bacteria)]
MTEQNRPSVSIIIVSYNTRDLTRGCLSSIFTETKDVEFDVYVVDNGSTDGSAEEIEREFPRVKLIPNPTNAGFARANNIAIGKSRAEYLFLLNPDTILVNNAVKIFLDYMEQPENRMVGCCGGSLYDEHMAPQIAYGNFPTLEEAVFKVLRLKKVFPKYYREHLKASSENLSNSTRRVDYIVGADMFLRKSVLDKTGLLDEDFFLYFEDTELSYRIFRQGFISMICPEAKIIHLSGKSSSDTSKMERIRIREKSRFLFYRKCYGERVALLIKILYLIKNSERLLLTHDKKNLEMLKIIFRS